MSLWSSFEKKVLVILPKKKTSSRVSDLKNRQINDFYTLAPFGNLPHAFRVVLPWEQIEGDSVSPATQNFKNDHHNHDFSEISSNGTSAATVQSRVRWKGLRHRFVDWHYHQRPPPDYGRFRLFTERRTDNVGKATYQISPASRHTFGSHARAVDSRACDDAWDHLFSMSTRSLIRDILVSAMVGRTQNFFEWLVWLTRLKVIPFLLNFWLNISRWKTSLNLNPRLYLR